MIENVSQTCNFGGKFCGEQLVRRKSVHDMHIAVTANVPLSTLDAKKEAEAKAELKLTKKFKIAYLLCKQNLAFTNENFSTLCA